MTEKLAADNKVNKVKLAPLTATKKFLIITSNRS